MRVRIGERSQAIIVLLPGRIPKRQFYVLAVHFDVCNIVLEHCRDIHLQSGE